MKQLLAAIVIILLIPSAGYAFPMVSAGKQHLQFGFESVDGDWRVEFGYGRFFTDELLLGMLFTYERKPARATAVSGVMEYHFNLGTMTYPYLSAIVIYEDHPYNDYFRYGPAAGINHFLTPYLSLDLKARYLYSSDSRRDEDLEFIGSLRVFF